LVKRISQGPHIRILDSIPNGDIGLITIENIGKFTIEIDHENLHYVSPNIVNEKDLLKKNDILTPRVRGLGNISLVDEDDKYIASENVLFIRFNDKTFKNFEIKFLAYYLATLGRLQIFLLQTGGKAGNINQELLKEIVIPEVSLELQKKIVNDIEKIEAKIKKEKQKIFPLQEVIDDVFVKYGVKSEKFKKGEFEVFTTNVLNIGRQKFLRCGAQYRAFWDIHEGVLFNGKTKYPIVKLGSLMRLHKTKTMKKGILDNEYILIELEDIEQRTGKILNMDRVVTEIGSDKTYFGDADLITTKLRPYLGYTILNIPELELIGTTELLPFKVNKDYVYPEYLKYVLLSHEYLEKSRFLMYGKEHPRIHPLDLLNIKIPLPDSDIQEKIIAEIQKQEKINDEAKQKLNDYRNEINNLIFEYLTDKGGKYND
jgi:restriction endonuclease S subunit